MAPPERRSPVPIAISFAIHIGAFIAVLGVPGVRLPHATDSEYKQKIAGNEKKLVWYKFRKELPAVSPAHAKADARELRAESIARQSIISSPVNAPKREQMVWTPAPELAPSPPVDSANLLAIQMPALPAKTFIAPPEAPRVERTQAELADPPPLSAKLDVKVPELGGPLPRKAFTPPKVISPELRKPDLLADAPVIAAGAGSPMVGLSTKLPPRPFTAPPSGRNAAPSRTIALDSPENLNVAVVGLKPATDAVKIPVLPSPGQFSAGARINPNGSAGDANGSAISVPSLFVGGPRTPAPKPGLLAQAMAAPTSAENIRAAMRKGEQVNVARSDPTPTATSRPAAMKVSSAPDPRFNGRDVYMMAIQLPNITSNSGSWLMWYSDHALRDGGQGPVSPPVPRRKVDPKYVATAVAERVEGRVQLACVIDREGKVSLIELVRSVDPRLDESAKEALSKWEFTPAMRGATPVDVDVLVEIPFRLAPLPPRR